MNGTHCEYGRTRCDAFRRVEGSGLEHDLVASRRAPGPTTPALGWKGSGPATPHAATDQDLEVSERHASALLLPDRAKREDRIEGGVRIHG